MGILAATSQRLEGARQALRSPCRDGSDGERERERERAVAPGGTVKS